VILDKISHAIVPTNIIYQYYVERYKFNSQNIIFNSKSDKFISIFLYINSLIYHNRT